MDTGKRQHLQDIYQTDEQPVDEFSNSNGPNPVRAERERTMRNQNILNVFWGISITVLAIALVAVIAKKSMFNASVATAPEALTQKYIPRYSLSAEKQWVLDFNNEYAAPEWDGEGERPFSPLWVKKAAFNLILAEQAEGFSQFKEAAEYYENALTILPEIEGVRIPLGMVYFKLKEFDKAIALFKEVPEDELTHDMLNNLGAACIEADAYEEAESYLKKSLEMKPAYAEALKNMAVLYREQKRDDEAISASEQYLDQRPSDISFREKFALYLAKTAKWELAAEQLEILTEEITDVATYFQLLAQVEVQLGHPEKAITALKRSLQLTDSKSALAWMDESEFDQLRESQDFQQIVKALETANDE